MSIEQNTENAENGNRKPELLMLLRLVTQVILYFYSYLN